MYKENTEPSNNITEKREISISDGLNKLKKDVENTTNFRKSLCEKLNLSENIHNNSARENFLLGAIDGMMEFPIIIEFYVSNSGFRDAFWREFRNLSIADFSEAIVEIGDGLIRGSAYEKGNSAIKSLLLFTGIGGVLRQFGVVIMRKGSNIILSKVGAGVAITGIHATGYALGNRGEKIIQSKITKK